ncbi:adenylyl-sulfate kinase 3-like isoform X1 [Vicia villosa]|uniref:adenylyl-sulfate kinase 3-like isoform X1 n=2 Tax=Vicia villosa TaxID=3911 RepID=UPI00273AB41C|nr:adenylyl-sulfate kinase 3-like isoform X1 [Vicia villosa]
MSTVKLLSPSCSPGMFGKVECRQSVTSPSPAVENLGFSKLRATNVARSYRSPGSLVLCHDRAKFNSRKFITAKEYTSAFLIDYRARNRKCSRNLFKPIKAKNDSEPSCTDNSKSFRKMSNIGNSTNILWHECPVQNRDRQQLLQQKGCVIWLTGLSGSGKSTIACALSQSLHSKGKLTYILDGDNIRHGLNRDLSFRAEDRSENIRRIGEVAKLFADAGVICITSLISPYQKDRDACRALLPEGSFIEVFIDVPLHVCEARDPKGLYKLARAGKIKGFTGIDDPYEPPRGCEIVLQQKGSDCKSPKDMADIVISYLEKSGHLKA